MKPCIAAAVGRSAAALRAGVLRRARGRARRPARRARRRRRVVGPGRSLGVVAAGAVAERRPGDDADEQEHGRGDQPRRAPGTPPATAGGDGRPTRRGGRRGGGGDPSAPGRRPGAPRRRHRSMLGAELIDIAHQHARLVSNARGRQIRSFCSVNSLPGQAGSAHRHIRFRRPTASSQRGASTNTTDRRPWLAAITPHCGQPIGTDGDSTVTTRPGSRRTTLITCRPGSSTNRSQRSQ